MAERISNRDFILAVPKYTSKFCWYFGKELLREASTVMFPEGSDQAHVHHLQQRAPLMDAQGGIKAIEKGRKYDEPELEFIGGAALTLAAIRAEDNQDISDHVTGEIVRLIHEQGIEPQLTPLLSDEQARRADEVISSHQPEQKVSHIFPGLK